MGEKFEQAMAKYHSRVVRFCPSTLSSDKTRIKSTKRVMLKIGQNIPEFETELDNGEPFRTSEFKGKKNIVVYFYPKDFSRG